MNVLGKIGVWCSPGVNERPQSGALVHAALALVLLLPQAASAEKVVLHHPVGAEGEAAPIELLDHVEERLAEALGELGHEVLFEHGVAEVPPPADLNEMRAIVDFHGGSYLVVPRVRVIEVGYELDVEVFWASKSRLERLRAEVHRDREGERLREVLFSMVNDRGVEDARETLEGPDRVARALAAEAAREAEEEATHVDEFDEEEEPSQDEELEEPASPEEQGARERDPPKDPARAWPLPPTMVQAALGLRPIALHDSRAGGGVIGEITLRGGRALASHPALEVRGALEVGFGAAGSASVLLGGAYLTPLGERARFRLGASVEGGLHGATTGDKGAAFAGRVALVADVKLVGPFRLELGLPELQYVSTGRGALTVGGYVGATARF